MRLPAILPPYYLCQMIAYLCRVRVYRNKNVLPCPELRLFDLRLHKSGERLFDGYQELYRDLKFMIFQGGNKQTFSRRKER
jgi:hypothetical protein